MVRNRRIRFVIVLDSCCISIGLVFIKDRPVSSFGCFVFEFWMLCFRDLGVFVFEFWVLRIRDLCASCFGLRFRNCRPQSPPSLKARLIRQLRIGDKTRQAEILSKVRSAFPSILSVILIDISHSDLHQDPAFPSCCLSKWFLQ